MRVGVGNPRAPTPCIKTLPFIHQDFDTQFTINRRPKKNGDLREVGPFLKSAHIYLLLIFLLDMSFIGLLEKKEIGKK